MPYDVSPEALASAHAGRRLALLVGVSEFEDSDWKTLRYAAKDARDLAQVLAERSRGAYARVLLRTAPDEVTRAGVQEALRTLAAENTATDDVVLVYVSSHGTLARDERGELRRYLVVRDTRRRDAARTAISIDDLKREMDRLPSRRKALVLATCHSGAGKSLLPAEVQQELEGIKGGFFVRPLEESSRASIVLAACDWGETAREDEALQNDIYTHFLVRALADEVDRNGDGAVTATEAHDYARRRTFEFTQGRQRPSAEWVEVGADPVVLSGAFRKTGHPELYSYAAALDGFTLRVDGAPIGELPGGIAVRPGARRVQVQKGDGPRLFDGTVELSVGERIAVEDLVARGAPRFAFFVRGGFAAFLDTGNGSGLADPALAAGAAVWVRDVPLPRLMLSLDAAYGGGQRRFKAPRPGATSVPMGLTLAEVGVAAAYAAPVGPLRIAVGPRLALMHLARRFELPTYTGTQQVFTVTPGLLVAVSLDLGNRFVAAVMAHGSFVYVQVDGEGRTLAMASPWLAIGYRF